MTLASEAGQWGLSSGGVGDGRDARKAQAIAKSRRGHTSTAQASRRSLPFHILSFFPLTLHTSPPPCCRTDLRRV